MRSLLAPHEREQLPSDQARAGTARSVLDQGVQVVLGELVAPVEERELDDEAAPDDFPAEALDELLRYRLLRSSRREHVVVDEHARAVRDHVRVQLERVLPVLERIGRADRLRRELPRPPCRHEPAADLTRDRRAEDEPARLRAEDEVRLLLPPPLRELLDRVPER